MCAAAVLAVLVARMLQGYLLNSDDMLDNVGDKPVQFKSIQVYSLRYPMGKLPKLGLPVLDDPVCTRSVIRLSSNG
jgi:hypothetical protein